MRRARASGSLDLDRTSSSRRSTVSRAPPTRAPPSRPSTTATTTRSSPSGESAAEKVRRERDEKRAALASRRTSPTSRYSSPSSSGEDFVDFSNADPNDYTAYVEDVRSYMKRVGLDAWYGYFEKHLPANIKSVRLVRATTAADLRRMATKANMRLDAAPTPQVLNALKKS